jgi:DNA-directed RNA polymerases I, II, and III subunit RPABC3
MSLLYQEQFQVKDVTKKFDKVARLVCRLAEELYEMELHLDVNSDLSTLELNDKFTFALASTLSPDGAPDSEAYNSSNAPSLMDQYEYVMYGKIYKWKQDQPKAPIEVHVSFGGLLMKLKGDARHLQNLELDKRIYLLYRKISAAR